MNEIIKLKRSRVFFTLFTCFIMFSQKKESHASTSTSFCNILYMFLQSIFQTQFMNSTSICLLANVSISNYSFKTSFILILIFHFDLKRIVIHIFLKSK